MRVDLIFSDLGLVDEVRRVIMVCPFDTTSGEELCREIETFLILRVGVEAKHSEFQLRMTWVSVELAFSGADVLDQEVDILTIADEYSSITLRNDQCSL